MSPRKSNAAEVLATAPACVDAGQRFEDALRRIQKRSVATGLDKLAEEEIDTLIDTVRSELATQSPEEIRAKFEAVRARVRATR